MKTALDNLKDSISYKLEQSKRIRDLQEDATNRRLYSERITLLFEILEEIDEFEEQERNYFLDENFTDADLAGKAAETFKGIGETLVGIAQGEKEAIEMMSKARYKRPTDEDKK